MDVNGTDHDIVGAIGLDHVTVSGIATVTGALDVNGDGHDIAGTIALDRANTSGITTTTSVRGYSYPVWHKSSSSSHFRCCRCSKTSVTDITVLVLPQVTSLTVKNLQSLPGSKTYRFDQAMVQQRSPTSVLS